MAASGPLVKFRQGYGLQDPRDGWLSVDLKTMFLYLGDGKTANQIVCGGQELDEEPKEYSKAGVESNGIYYALLKKQDKLVEGPGIVIDENNVISTDIVIPKIDIHSDNHTVKCEHQGDDWNLEILSPEIIEYLEGLVNWNYIYGATGTGKTLEYPNTKGVISATLTAKRWRGLDQEHNTPEKAVSVEIISSESTSANWYKTTASKWSYEYNWTDLTLDSDIVSFDGSFVTANETSGTGSCKVSVTMVKPYIIVEGSVPPTGAELDVMIDGSGANKKALARVGSTDIEWEHEVGNRFFYICIPPKRTAKFEQIAGMSALDAKTSTADTKLGTYTIYKSTNPQKPHDPIKGKLIIS